MFPATFTSIDFETASRRPDSACQLGLVTVEQGRVTEESCWLIRPKPFIFHPSNIRIHGITPEQVCEEPEFSSLWGEIEEKIGGRCLVAHNASFDLRVLLSTLRTQRLPIPEFEYTCTRAIAKKTWPHLRRFGLKPLSDWLGIRFQHHDALEDALACAKLLLAAGMDQDCDDLPDLEKKLRLQRGRAGSWGMKGPSTQRKRSEKKRSEQRTTNHLPFIKPSDLPGFSTSKKNNSRGDNADPAKPDSTADLQRLMIRLEFIRPLAQKKLFVSGPFREFSTQEIRQLVSRSGAILTENIDENPDFIIEGNDICTSKPSKEALNERKIQKVLSAHQLIHYLKSSSMT